jgi:tetratricopeptide (TPR) repeat protein
VFLGVTACALLFTAHSGAIRLLQASAQRADSAVTVPREAVFADVPVTLPPEMADAARRAITGYERVAPMRAGGLGLFSTRGNDVRLAWLYACTHDWSAARSALDRAIARHGESEGLVLQRLMLMRRLGEPDAAMTEQLALLDANPSWLELRADTAGRLAASGRVDDAIATCRAGLEHAPDSQPMLRQLALLLLGAQRADEAMPVLRRAIDAAPREPYGYLFLAEALMMKGDPQAALVELERARRLAPNDPQILISAVTALQMLNRLDEAEALRRTIQQMMQEPSAPPRTDGR